MNKFIITLISLIVCSHLGYAQSDEREVVGVAKFTCETDDRFTGLVTEKIVEVLTNSKRFQVVDRTSYDKVHEELEFQKSEAFIDSENTAEQGVAVAAESLVTGHIIKIPVYAMKNANDGSYQLSRKGKRFDDVSGKCRYGSYEIVTTRIGRIFSDKLSDKV